MNEANLNRIFTNYIEKFDILNGPVHKEYFKWIVAKKFKPMMDEALSVADSDFAGKLSKIQKLTDILADTRYAQPFKALVQYSKKFPEVVRGMFSDLYFGDDELQDRIDNFLTRSHDLKQEFFPKDTSFKNDVHSVTVYLSMYDPDNHYIFKPRVSRDFADRVEFYDDWGSGDTVKIDVYYRMCDQLVEAINVNKELLAADARRFSGEIGVDPESLYRDPCKHILVWDLIYCSPDYKYNLFYGIPNTPKTPTERKAAREGQEQAALQYRELSEKLDRLASQLQTFEETKAYLLEVFSVGAQVTHRVFGKGKVADVDDDDRNGLIVSVHFADTGIKRLMLSGVLNGRLLFPDSEKAQYQATIESCQSSLALLERTKMEALMKSIGTTERAIKELGKTAVGLNTYID